MNLEDLQKLSAGDLTERDKLIAIMAMEQVARELIKLARDLAKDQRGRAVAPVSETLNTFADTMERSFPMMGIER